MLAEGVIKFEPVHRHGPLEAPRYAEPACQLIACRDLLVSLGVLGQRPDRYEGAAFGNVSLRVGPRAAPRGRRAFLVTGTRTGAKADLGLGDLALVEAYDYEGNRVESRGLVRPSSEAMSHGAVYDAGPHLSCALHVHCPELWTAAGSLRLPVTDPAFAYGTPGMAEEVRRLCASGPLAERRVLAMGGHEDGVIAFGRTTEEALQSFIVWLGRAHRHRCDLRLAAGKDPSVPPTAQ